MDITRTVADAVRRAQVLPRPRGLVPTMGALHAGHRSLVEHARGECAAVVASVFVNPLQFGPNEDFARYPRAFEQDAATLERGGVDLLFAPGVDEMYPPDFETAVDPGSIATRYEGALRPGHFRGVATVCTKLFAISGADRAYFGAKDAQQLAVVRSIVDDLRLPLEIVAVPTVREPDGLALSSRNAYLSPAERAAAPGLYEALRAMANAVERGERERRAIVAAGRARLQAPLREAYLDVVDPRTFLAIDHLQADESALAIGSVWVGATRLIDNVALAVPAARGTLHAANAAGTQ